ncbi:MAG: NAD(P) transhydrogenase subunit alpha, partial [Ruminococcaceae bacterium]|nr:NAD(P) transhydrogenase subunit alpha [Oscillospiraceae bacterium]
MAYGYDLLIFVFSALIGYRLIRKVPSLLHTPLMSGTNSLSGLTIVGAVAAAGAAVT